MSARVISYIRFSTVGQSLGDSEKRQLEQAEKYCREHGLTLAPDDVLRDLGRSAYRGTHRKEGAFAEFLAAIDAEAVSRGTILIVEAWDRLSREPPVSALHQMTGIIKAGIKIVTLIDQQEHDEATVNAQPHRLFHSLAMIIAANAESKAKSVRVKKSYETRRQRAVANGERMSAARKAWLDIDPKTGKFVPNPEGAKTVRRIFEMVADGMGCFTVARRLQAEYNDKGKPVPLSGDKKSRGWHKSRIQAIIQSDAPLGVLHTHTRAEDGKTRVSGERIEGYYPVIVEQTLANRARAQMTSRTYGGNGAGAKGKLYSNLFTGLAKCSCGSSMFLADVSAPRRKHGFLRCSDAYNKLGKCTNHSGVPYPKLERQVLSQIQWFNAMRHVATHDPSKELAEQIAEKEAEAERINATLSSMTEAFGPKPLPALVAQMRQMAERHATIENKLVELRQQHLIIVSKAERPDLLSERDRLLAQAASTDPQTRYDARTRIAVALRDTIETMVCMPDKSVRLFVPSVKFESDAHPRLQRLAPDNGQETMTITSKMARQTEKFVTEKMIVDDANVTVLTDRVMHNPVAGGGVMPGAVIQDTVLRTLSFSMSLSPNGETRVLMDVDPPLSKDLAKDVDITGVEIPLVVADIYDLCRPDGTRPAIKSE